MSEGQSLNDILNDEPEDTVEAQPAEAAPSPANEPEEAPDGPVRDESGRFAAKTGVEPEPEGEPEAVPPTDKLPKEDYKAIREEREKRQALERELEALRAQAQQPKEPPAPPPSVWEDENAWGGNLVSTAVQQATFNARLDMSEMMTRQANADFEEMKSTFLELAAQNPTLREQALADPHPWNKAYQIAKNHKSMQELGAVDLADLEAKMRDKIMAEMQASAPVAPAVPPSLTGERNVAPRSGPAWTGPKSLSEILR